MIREWVRKWLGIAAPAVSAPHVETSLDIAERLSAEIEDAPRDPYAHPLTLPISPKQNGKMAFDDAPAFGYGTGGGYLNSIAGQAAFSLYFPGYPALAMLAQKSEFRQPVETTAKELTRKWIEFKSNAGKDKAERIKELKEAFETFEVQHKVRRACEQDGFYGLGFIYIRVRDQEHSSELPLILDDNGGLAKGQLLGFQNIEPMWVTPLAWNSNDPLHPMFYKAEFWTVLGKKVHHTRMFKFVSREVPDILKPAYNFGGISLTQLIQPYVDRWLQTVNSVNKIISNFSIIKLLTNMAAVLAGGPAGDLVRRLKFFNRNRDNQGVFVADKNSEDLEQIAVPLSGLSELQAQAQEHQAAPTHLPLVVLTGITPAGLNASSDSEMEVFRNWINAVQEALIRPPLTLMFHAIQLHLWGEIDDALSFDFKPLKELTGEAAARVVKSKGEVGVAYVQNGVIAPEEERQRLADDPDSGYLNLDVASIPEPPEEPPETTSAGTGGNGEDAAPGWLAARRAQAWEGGR